MLVSCDLHREEVRRAAIAAPVAIFVAVIGTGLIGWLLNISLVLCSGPIENLPGPAGLAFIEVRCFSRLLEVWLTENMVVCVCGRSCTCVLGRLAHSSCGPSFA